MTKFGKILIFGIMAAITPALALVFSVERTGQEIEKINQKDGEDMIMDSTNFLNQTLSTKEVREMLSSASLNKSEMQEWKNYTSEKLGISFKYPPDYLVAERGVIRIFEDTPHNRYVEKMLNPDFDYVIPEDLKNVEADIEPSQDISFSKSIKDDFTQDVVEWYRENKYGENADRDVYAPADFIGINSVAYQAEGLFTFDGIMFEREGYLYQFSVKYFASPESPRDNFYKIISTVEFQ